MPSSSNHFVSRRNRYDILWHQSFSLLIASSKLIKKLTVAHLGHLILLTGVSCSGKSSVADAMQKIDGSVIHIDLDEILRDVVFQFLMEREKKLVVPLYKKFGKDLPAYIFYHQLDQKLFPIPQDFAKQAEKLNELIKKEGSLLEKKLLFNIHNKIKEQIFYGKQIVISLVATQSALNPFHEFSPIIVTLYTPLSELISNLHQRNARAVLQSKVSEYRNPEVVFSQSQLFFSRDVANSIEPALDNMALTQVQDMENNYLLAAKDPEFLKVSYKPVIQPAQETSINPDKKFYLYLRENTDLLLNAQGLKSDVLAGIMRTFLQNEQYFKASKKQSYIYLDKLSANPALIIFDGMSCSGKTTIAQTFLRQASHSILLHRSEQQKQLVLNKMPSELRRRNYRGISIFAYARYRQHPAFREDFKMIEKMDASYLEKIDKFTQIQQAEIFCLEEKYAAKKAKKFLQMGINVLLDNLIKKENLSEFSQLNPIVILVYCPFAKILSHMVSRHQQAINKPDPSKWRDPFMLYKSYGKFFGQENKHHISRPLETLRKEQVSQILQEVFHKFPPEKFAINRDEFLQEMFENLGLHDNEKVEVYPQLCKPDIILDAQSSPEANVQFLFDFFEKKNGSELNNAIQASRTFQI